MEGEAAKRNAELTSQSSIEIKVNQCLMYAFVDKLQYIANILCVYLSR